MATHKRKGNKRQKTDKLVDLQKKMKDLEEDTGPKNVTNNSLFVGSTSDLQKMLKQMNKNDK